MAVLRLALLVSRAHQRALHACGILERSVQDFLFEERLLRIQAQLTAAIAIREILTEMGFEVPNTIDLAPLVEIAGTECIFNRRECDVLLQINREANEAKHDMVFRSRI